METQFSWIVKKRFISILCKKRQN